jgi:hypothetical protein
MSPADLHVVAVVSNPVRFASRYRLYRQFADRIAAAGVHLITVEHAFADRPFEVTSPHNPDHVQLRGGQPYELWLKESLINVGFRHLTQIRPGWTKAAWLDADIEFVRPDWAIETLLALDHYEVVQPWSHAVDLGPKSEPMTNEWGNDVDRSFCCAYQLGRFEPDEPYRSVARPLKDADDWRHHAGYAWAITRRAYEAVGGLIDWLVTGSADFHMALGFTGRMLEHIEKNEADMTPGYRRRLGEFAEACETFVQRRVGYVPGLILHAFHGHKKDRGYLSRHDIIRKSKFDPDIDIVRDANGVWALTGANRELRDGLMAYFRARNEDAT